MVKYLHKKANDDPVPHDLIPGADGYAEPPDHRQGRPLRATIERKRVTDEEGRFIGTHMVFKLFVWQ